MTKHTEKYKALPQNFDQDVKIVARELLGCRLCMKTQLGNVKKQVISETEAYDGESDLACHVSRVGRKEQQLCTENGTLLCISLLWDSLVVECGYGCERISCGSSYPRI